MARGRRSGRTGRGGARARRRRGRAGTAIGRAVHACLQLVDLGTGEGLEELMQRIEDVLPRPAIILRLLVPYDRGDVLSRLHVRGSVLETEYREDGTLVTARVDEREAATLAAFLIAG